MENNIILCKNVTLKCKSNNIVIDNFSYEFKKGKIYAIIGNQGEGKTTLISSIIKMIKINDGQIILNWKKTKDVKKNIGYIFQFSNHQLFKNIVWEDVAFGLKNFKLVRNNLKDYVKEKFTSFNFDSTLLDKSIYQLSYGQKKVVAIAGVMVCNPNIIIFDEPFALLDNLNQEKIIEIIRKLKKLNKTVIFVSHNMDRVLEIADDVLLINNHKLLFHGTPYQVFTNKKIINNAQIALPKIISFINSLIKYDPSFHSFLTRQPKNIADLVKLIK